MSYNSFGHLFRVTTWGESHGPALGCVVDGCPPGMPLSEADIQPWLDARRPGQSRFTTQRQEADQVEILSGTFEGRDHRHADLADDPQHRPALEGLWRDRVEVPARPCRHHLPPQVRPARLPRRRPVVGARDRRAGRRRRRSRGRRWPCCAPRSAVRGALVQMGDHAIDRAAWDWDEVPRNPFWCPDPAAAAAWAGELDALRKSGNSVGAVVEVVGRRRPARPRRADLRQARQRHRRGADDDQRGQGGRDRRRLRARRR